MFLAIDKRTREVRHIYHGKKLDRPPEKIWPDYDRNTMDLLELDQPASPHFFINAKGHLTSEPIAERLQSGALSLADLCDGVWDQADAFCARMNALLDDGCLGSAALLDEARALIDRAIARAVARAYTLDRELKIVKDCLTWLMAGQSENDPRPKAYSDMQAELGQIKKPFAALKDRLEQARAALAQKPVKPVKKKQAGKKAQKAEPGAS